MYAEWEHDWPTGPELVDKILARFKAQNLMESDGSSSNWSGVVLVTGTPSYLSVGQSIVQVLDDRQSLAYLEDYTCQSVLVAENGSEGYNWNVASQVVAFLPMIVIFADREQHSQLMVDVRRGLIPAPTIRIETDGETLRFWG